MGRVLLGDTDITRVLAARRPLNMVFQRPTLFPHLDVADNVAFGLRVAKVERAERDRRVAEALRLVRLEGYGKRRADELSGGPDAAHRARPRARQPPARAAARRAALGARSQDPARDGGRAAAHPSRVGRDVRVRHARSARGARAVRPRGRLQRGPRRPGRDAGRDLPLAPRRRSRPASWATRTCCRCRSRAWRAGMRRSRSAGRRSSCRHAATARGSARPGSSCAPRSCGWPRAARCAASCATAPSAAPGFTYQLDVAGIEEPFKAEVTSEGQAVLLPLGSEIGLHWHPSACVLLAREEDV